MCWSDSVFSYLLIAKLLFSFSSRTEYQAQHVIYASNGWTHILSIKLRRHTHAFYAHTSRTHCRKHVRRTGLDYSFWDENEYRIAISLLFLMLVPVCGPEGHVPWKAMSAKMWATSLPKSRLCGCCMRTAMFKPLFIWNFDLSYAMTNWPFNDITITLGRCSQ